MNWTFAKQWYFLTCCGVKMGNSLWVITPEKQFFLTSSPSHSAVVPKKDFSCCGSNWSSFFKCIPTSNVLYLGFRCVIDRREGSVWSRLLKAQTLSFYFYYFILSESSYTVGAKENLQFFLRIFSINMSWKDHYIWWHVLQREILAFLS